MDAGDPYICDASSLGDKGTRVLDNVAGLPPPSFCIWRERPRLGNMGRLGVLGLEKESSFDTRRAGSRNAGDGDSVGFGASLKERGFGEFTPVLSDDEEVGVLSPSSNFWVKADFPEVEARCCSAMAVIDMSSPGRRGSGWYGRAVGTTCLWRKFC